MRNKKIKKEEEDNPFLIRLVAIKKNDIIINPIYKNNKRKKIKVKKLESLSDKIKRLNTVSVMNIDLNITLSCNLSCNGCNRMCDIYKNRTEHMSLEQIDKFIQQCKSPKNYKIGTIRLIGGEPLKHPLFIDIYKSFIKKDNQRHINKILVFSNGTIKTDVPSSNLIISAKNKHHIPYFIHPKDLGYKIGPQETCFAFSHCGFSLDKYGYLPCPMAIMIVRLFRLTHLYRYNLPRNSKPWGLEELCQHCIWGMPLKWRKTHTYNLNNFPAKYKISSIRFKKAIENFNVHKFYKTQKEF